VAVTIGWSLYRCAARLFKPVETPKFDAEKSVFDAERDAALNKFRQIHAHAYDHRKKIATAVNTDPQGAAKIVGKMIKRK
jgi:hypothetical protein